MYNIIHEEFCLYYPCCIRERIVTVIQKEVSIATIVSLLILFVKNSWASDAEYVWTDFPFIWMFIQEMPSFIISFSIDKHVGSPPSVWKLFSIRKERVGAVVRALAFHHYRPGSISWPAVICGLSLLVLYSVLRGFSPGAPVFPSHQKPVFDLICCGSVWFVVSHV